MPTKDECLKAVENLRQYEEWGTHPEIEDIQVFEKLIIEHFDLLKYVEKLEKINDKQSEQIRKSIENNKPCEFIGWINND